MHPFAGPARSRLWMRLVRTFRYLRPDHNPLRRRLDRVHAYVIVGLVAAFVIGAPVVTVLTAHASYQAELRAARHEARTRHQVDAVVLGIERQAAPFATSTQAKVRWPVPTGGTRTGHTAYAGGDRAGTHKRVWIDAAGNLTSAPRGPGNVTGEVIVTSVSVCSMLTLLLFLGYLVADHELERRRMNMWDREWIAVAQRWTGRR